MSDILSGGAIDETTSGPIPASQDNRSLDIIAETAAKQERDAIGGSQNPPTVEAPPPIPQPPEVAPPPLPDIDIPQLGIDFGPAAEATREIARQATVDVLKRVTINGQSPIIEGSSISFNTESKSIFDENFGTMGNTNFLQPMYGNPLNSPDFGTRAGMEERSVAEAFARGEERRRARVEAQPDFDRESDQRQRGESASQFRERQEILRIERKEAEKQEKLLQRAREGDVSELPSGMVPVRLTRADGRKKILALMATEFVGVVEGATGGDRTAALPATNSYYEGGGGESCVGLALYTKTVGTPPNTTTQVWVSAGAVAGELPSGFDPIEGKVIATGGSGYVAVLVTINQSNGTIASVQVNGGYSSFPDDNNTDYYYVLGYYEYESNEVNYSNYGCGSIEVRVCRRYFTNDSDNPYSASLSRY